MIKVQVCTAHKQTDCFLGETCVWEEWYAMPLEEWRALDLTRRPNHEIWDTQ